MDLVDDSPVPRANPPGVTAGELLRRWRSRLVSQQDEYGGDSLLAVTRELCGSDDARQPRFEPYRSQTEFTTELIERNALPTFSLRRVVGRDVL